MSPDRLLDREVLKRAFDLLAGKLARRGVVGELHVFAGAAMVLAFDARPATRDVDALLHPDGPVLEAAGEVAAELGLARSWLHDQASSLRLRAWYLRLRPSQPARDAEDLRLLLRELELRTLADVVEVVEQYFPDEPLTDRARRLVEDLLAERRYVAVVLPSGTRSA